MRTHGLEAEALGVVGKPFHADAEVHAFGSRTGRLVEVGILLVAAGCGLAFAIWPRTGDQTIWLLALSFWATVAALGQLTWAYELRISPAGVVTCTSLLGTTEFHGADIARIVRRERVSNGALDTIGVEYLGGSVSLAGREEVFARLTALRPSAQVTREMYDDTAD